MKYYWACGLCKTRWNTDQSHHVPCPNCGVSNPTQRHPPDVVDDDTEDYDGEKAFAALLFAGNELAILALPFASDHPLWTSPLGCAIARWAKAVRTHTAEADPFVGKN